MVVSAQVDGSGTDVTERFPKVAEPVSPAAPDWMATPRPTEPEA